MSLEERIILEMSTMLTLEQLQELSKEAAEWLCQHHPNLMKKPLDAGGMEAQ